MKRITRRTEGKRIIFRGGGKNIGKDKWEYFKDQKKNEVK
jgi:hypothetical protein